MGTNKKGAHPERCYGVGLVGGEIPPPSDLALFGASEGHQAEIQKL